MKQKRNIPSVKIQLLGMAGLLLINLQDHLWEDLPWWRFPHIGFWGVLRGIPWRGILIAVCVVVILIGFFEKDTQGEE